MMCAKSNSASEAGIGFGGCVTCQECPSIVSGVSGKPETSEDRFRCARNETGDRSTSFLRGGSPGCFGSARRLPVGDCDSLPGGGGLPVGDCDSLPGGGGLPVRCDHNGPGRLGAFHLVTSRKRRFTAWGFAVNDDRCGHVMRRLAANDDRSGFRAMVEHDDLVMVRAMMTRRSPSRRCGRTRLGAHPMPHVAVVEPPLVIRDVLVLIKNVAVLRDLGFGLGHNDRAGDRDDFLRDDLLRDDGFGRSDDDRSGKRLHDRPHEVHDVRGQLNAVARPWRFGMGIACESRRSEDDRCRESRADNECLVDGLLDRVSYGERLRFDLPETKNIFDFLIILYSKQFDLSNDFLNFFRLFFEQTAV